MQEKDALRVRFRQDTSKFKRAICAKNRAISRLRERAKKADKTNMSHESAVQTVLDTVQSMLSADELTLLKTHLQNSGKKRRTIPICISN
jgi:hypothetical protein